MAPVTTPARLLTVALAFWAAAGGAYGTLRAVFGDRPAYVHVRWAPGVDDGTRSRLEQAYALADPEPKEDRTIGYALTDISHANVRALVLDPAVEDTHQIHRTAFRVGYLSPRLPYRTTYPQVPDTLEALVGIAAGLGLLGAALAAVVRLAGRRLDGRLGRVARAYASPAATLREAVARLLAWIAARVPDGSPESAALFRIVFGAGLLLLVLGRPIVGAWAAEPSNVISPVHAATLRVLGVVPAVADWLPTWIGIWGALFILGAFTRTAFACLAIGVFVWAAFYTTRITYHTVSALLLALIALQWARWADAWSLDAWRGPLARVTSPRTYGYTTWVPGFVLGVTFAAAAVAKLRDGGIAWILNGTVKYHFLSDSPQAMVTWGPWIGQQHWLSVLLSLAAIGVESLVIAGALARHYPWRLAAGAAALALLTGFVLLQGLFWPGWWLLLLSFLPWHRVRPAGMPAAGIAPRRSAFAHVALAVLLTQAVVSLFRLEVSPLLSTYDMYSTTYASPAEYEQKAGATYWVLGRDEDEELHRCRVSRPDAERLVRLSPARIVADPVVRRCFAVADDVEEISLEARRVQIDWDGWRRIDQFRSTRLLGPFPVDWP